MSVQRQIERLVVHRAAEWVEVLRTERTEEYPAFVEWISESPRHLDEFLKVLALSQAAQDAVRQSTFDKDTLLARVSPQVTEFRNTGRIPRNRETQRRWIHWGAVLVVTCAALAVVVFSLFADFWRWQSFETPIGVQRTVSLADGSVVILNAKSRVKVRLGSTGRDVRLLGGEALFKVAKDPKRPFLVHTRDAVVQAVGTQFDVAARRFGTRVAVLEGRVRVSAKEQPALKGGTGSSSPVTAPSPEPLEAGQALHVSQRGAIERKSDDDAANATAWRQRQLIFDGTPLEDAVDDFNRYHQSTQLRLEGIAADSHHYSGTFNADDLASFVDLLSHEKDLAIERRDGEILIRSRP